MQKIVRNHTLKKLAVVILLLSVVCVPNMAEAGFRLKKKPAVEEPAIPDTQNIEAPATTTAPQQNYSYPDIRPQTPQAGANFQETGNSVVAGFGNDLPLVIALQQVAPEQYQFSFAGDIDPGTKVSWKGDRPWRAVLTDMLETQGLAFREDRDIIVIEESATRMTTETKPLRRPSDEKTNEKIETADGKPLDLKNISAPRVIQPNAYIPPAAPTPHTAPVWEAQPGQTLREVLAQWSIKEGVELYWSIDYDYRIEKYFAYEGNYPTAVATLINRFKESRPQPYGQLHKGSRTALVLVIGSYDLTH